MPHFKPSQPVEEASSFTKALDICASYQIQGESNLSASPLLSRVSVLTPWIRCFEKVLITFPEARLHVDFIAFYRELYFLHQSVQPADAKVIHWPMMNQVVLIIVAYLKQLKTSFSEEESRLMAQTLPGFTTRMLERRKVGNQVWVSTEITDPDIIRLKNSLKKIGLFTHYSFTQNQKEYCSDYQDFKEMVYHLIDLVRYENYLSKQAGSQQMFVHSRVQKLKERSLKKYTDLQLDFQAIRLKWPWFKTEYCKK